MTFLPRPGSLVALLALVVSATAADARPIRLDWDASADSRVTGYIIYYGTEPGVYSAQQDVGSRLTWSLDLPGPQYYFVVRGYDADGNVGDPSLEVGDTPGVFLTNPGPQYSLIERSVTLPLAAAGLPVDYRATGLPPGLSVNATTGVVSGTFDSNADASSPYLVTARVADAAANVSSVQFIWTVRRNHAPLLTNPGSQNAIAGLSVSRTIEAWDLDGDTVTFAAAGLPAGLSIDAATGVISGTLAFDAADTYAVTVTASDAMVSSAVSFSWTVAPPGQLAIDQIVSADGYGTVVTTPPFSTSLAGETLVAFVAASQPTLDGVQAASVTGGGLTWTPVTRANAQAGSAEIWQATAAGILSNIAVTATVDIGSDPLTITVISFAGSGGVGASAAGSAATGAPTVSLTTTQPGSLVYGTGNDWDDAVVRTPAPNQTMVHELVTTTRDSYWVQNYGAPIANAGTLLSLADTAPTTDRWNFSAVEIVPRPTPPTVSATTQTAMSITATGAVLQGTVTSNASAASAHFEYGPTSSYGIRTGSSPLGLGTSAARTTVSGLTCNTSYHFRLVAANADGTAAGDDAVFTTSTCPAPTIVTSSPWTSAIAGTAYTFTLAAAGGATPYAWDIIGTSPLPAGLTLAADSGVVSGTPLADGSFQVGVRATGANGLSSTRTFALTVTPVVDPLRAAQWHLHDRAVENGAADVEPVWPTTQGGGVVVGIVDDGLQWTHPDLEANYVSSLSHDFEDGDDDPSPLVGGPCGASANCRGTELAGIVAARRDNGIGGSGVAPRAGLAGLRLTAAGATDARLAAALDHELQAIHIELNSSPSSHDGRTLAAPGPLTGAALVTAARLGRGGKGRAFVWAAGDGRANGDNCNFDGFVNSRYVIAVGATDDSGLQAPYSEPCSALLVSAPSSGVPGVNRSLITTDLVGAAGDDSTDYTTSAGGTPAAAAVVSGVVALILARNPALTWRDVQHVLVRSSRRVDLSDPGWSSGPFPHNEKYGFGLVDAKAAVDLAAAWTPVVPETAVPDVVRPVNRLIPDNQSGGVSDTAVVGGPEVIVEHIEVELSATHARRGDLDVSLTSPAGTVSHLAPVRPLDDGANFSAWKFRTVRHWGERSSGRWTLTVSDRVAGSTGTFDQWTLRVFGTVPAPSPGEGDGGGGGGGDAPPAPSPVPPPTEPRVPPDAPAGLFASVYGSTVVLSWVPPSAGGSPTSYILEAGSSSGRSDLVTLATGNTITSYSAFGVAAGTYYVRVRAVNDAGQSGPSNEVVVTVRDAGPSPGGPPQPPSGLIASSTGTNVMLTWNPPTSGGAPTSYIIEAGSAPGLTDLAVVSTGSSSTAFSASGVNPGVYYVRVRAANAFGISAPSATTQLVVTSAGGPGPCTSAPAPPGSLQFQVTGSTVTLRWSAAAGSPTSYVLEAGTRPTAIDVVQFDTGNLATSLSAADVAGGTYFVRIRARNGCGTSAPSNEVTIVVR